MPLEKLRKSFYLGGGSSHSVNNFLVAVGLQRVNSVRTTTACGAKEALGRQFKVTLRHDRLRVVYINQSYKKVEFIRVKVDFHHSGHTAPLL